MDTYKIRLEKTTKPPINDEVIIISDDDEDSTLVPLISTKAKAITTNEPPSISKNKRQNWLLDNETVEHRNQGPKKIRRPRNPRPKILLPPVMTPIAITQYSSKVLQAGDELIQQLREYNDSVQKQPSPSIRVKNQVETIQSLVNKLSKE